jgi:hypothetical protein
MTILIKGSVFARPAYYTLTVTHPLVMQRLMLLAGISFYITSTIHTSIPTNEVYASNASRRNYKADWFLSAGEETATGRGVYLKEGLDEQRYQHKADFVNGQWPQYSWVTCMNRKLGKYPHHVAPLFEDEDPDHACEYCSRNGHPCIVSFEGLGPVCLPRSEADRGPATPEDAGYYVLPEVSLRTRGRPKKGHGMRT